MFFDIYDLSGFSKFGHLRIGGQNAKPEFKTLSWFAMLFSAGSGARKRTDTDNFLSR
jgi:choline-glycine betaine transporter